VRSVDAVIVLENCAQSNTMSLYRLNHTYLRSSCYPGEVVMPIIIYFIFSNKRLELTSAELKHHVKLEGSMMGAPIKVTVMTFALCCI
jgi:hypothetical protein